MKKNDNKKLQKWRQWKLFFVFILSLMFVQISYGHTKEQRKTDKRVLLKSESALKQQVTITGTVKDANTNEPVIGANIIEEGAKTGGAVTDVDGNFSIKVSSNEATLAISFIGYLTENVVIGGRSSIEVLLTPDITALDEIVVVGYGTQKKADLSSAIATVNSEDLATKPVSTFEQAMQGVSAGITITSNRGAPGEGAIMRIRGVGSVNNTNPLIVIDGIPTDGTTSLDPQDIESVQILKDAASAAIYGARGANGVVLISTKKGKSGTPQFSFDAYYGIQQAWRTLDLLEGEEYVKLVIETNYNNKKGKSPLAARDPDSLRNNTDWQKAMFRTAPIKKYNFSFSGGNDRSSQYVSAGYFAQDGIMIGTSYESFNLRVNNNMELGRIKFGESIALKLDKKSNEPSAGDRSQIEQILKMPPLVAVYDTNSLGGYAGPTNDDGHDGANPAGVAASHLGKDDKKSLVGSLFATIKIFEGLNYDTRLGADYSITQSSFLLKAHQMGNVGGVASTYLKEQSAASYNLIFENTLTYSKQLGKHFIKILAGYTSEQGRREYIWASRKNFPLDGMALHAGSENKDNDGERFETALLSTLGRFEYVYNDKYLLTANARRDGSSRFGESLRISEVFPSLSIAWKVNKEGFMQGISDISELKLRGSWGKIGNQDIGDYQFEASMNSYNNYVLNDKVVTGVGPSIFANSSIQWETTIQTDLGMDLGLFNNKLNFTADYYIKETEGMLVKVPIAGSNGFRDEAPYQNSGSVSNKGLELSLGYKNLEGDFKYSVTGNFSYLKNEVLSIGDGGIPITSGVVESEKGGITRTDVGQPIGAFYVYRTDGLYRSQEDIDAMNKLLPSGKYTRFAFFAQPGDIRYKDLNNDGNLTSEDREFAGSPIPKFEYGLTINIDYKGFDLNIFLQGVYGNKIYNENRVWTEGMFANWNASTVTLDRYRAKDTTITSITGDGRKIQIFYPANTDTDVPRAIVADPNKNALKGSDRFLEDGSYLRLKTLTLGYTLPKSVVSKIKLSRVRLYVTGQNLLTFTKYTGYDPEIGSNQVGDSNGPVNLSRGIDNGYYPQPRTILGGIQIGF
jgi:TonB-linked SusC/RagA family outer membrane protein